MYVYTAARINRNNEKKKFENKSSLTALYQKLCPLIFNHVIVYQLRAAVCKFNGIPKSVCAEQIRNETCNKNKYPWSDRFVWCVCMCLSVCAKMMRNQTRVGHTTVDLETAIIGTHPNCFDPTMKMKQKLTGRWPADCTYTRNLYFSRSEITTMYINIIILSYDAASVIFKGSIIIAWHTHIPK